MAIQESTHWYDQAGKPAYTIVGKNGKERATTLRDAREHNYFPSVTTIFGMIAKPGLENWKIDQALLSALTLPKLADESLSDFMARAKKDAKEQSIKAAEAGTLIHADIEKGFKDGTRSPAYNATRKELDIIFPGIQWIAEDSFSSTHGFGGKVDLYSPAGIVVDFKTKDGITQEASKLVYDEHGMQLSAYALGLGFDEPIRVSIFIDRTNPGYVVSHVWDKESHRNHADMFLSILRYWQLSKNYCAKKD
jgi:hypothetical protein